MSPKPPYEISLEIEERLRFETLIADLSLRFVNVAADRVDQEIEDAQRAICECLGLEHSSVWQASIQNPGELVLTHLYRDPELPRPPDHMSGSEFFPWAQAKLIAGEIVSVPNTAEAPTQASRDRETWLRFGVKSTLGFPLSVGGGAVFGVVSFEAIREARACPESLVKRLQLIAQVFANALERKRAEQKLRDSEARLKPRSRICQRRLMDLRDGNRSDMGNGEDLRVVRSVSKRGNEHRQISRSRASRGSRKSSPGHTGGDAVRKRLLC